MKRNLAQSASPVLLCFVCMSTTRLKRQLRTQITKCRCCIRRPFADCSGSMCVAYSTLGLKEGEESQNAILMLIWAFKHFEMQTPLLVHENVAGFASQSLKEEAFHKGYDHFEIRSKPIDFGVHVGRARKYLAGRSVSNFFVCIPMQLFTFILNMLG